MQKKHKNLKEFKQLTKEEREERIIDLKKELIFINIKLKTKQNSSSHIVRKIKTQIAQLYTLQTLGLNNKN
uniref:Large ribosomal subunit protein uL29c n=1 Tax=Taenioma perpusillum TaxID=210852 RepID=A0A1Z1MRQ1_9FLOR|nr:ribosomal protein L29 [Taenioma perpusillum]ARW68549.1 ribosomal protein L29 [Taenioma perpusillum]